MKVILVSEFANCALGLLANLFRKHAMLTEHATLRQQLITTYIKEVIVVVIPKKEIMRLKKGLQMKDEGSWSVGLDLSL